MYRGPTKAKNACIHVCKGCERREKQNREKERDPTRGNTNGGPGGGKPRNRNRMLVVLTSEKNDTRAIYPRTARERSTRKAKRELLHLKNGLAKK